MSKMAPIKAFFSQTRTGLFLYILVKRFFAKGCTYRSASLVYTTLLGMVPFIFISITMLSFLPGYKDATDPISSWIAPILAPDQLYKVDKFINEFLIRINEFNWLNMLFLVISCTLMVRNMASALNDIWQTHKHRSRWVSSFVYIVTVVLGPLCMGAVSILWALISHWPHFAFVNHIPFLVPLADTMMPYFVLGALMTILYVVLPAGKVPIIPAMVASASVIVLFVLMKVFFVSVMLQRSSTYILYGNLSLVPILMVWLYFMWVVVLLGALIGYNVANGLSLAALKKLAKEC